MGSYTLDNGAQKGVTTLKARVGANLAFEDVTAGGSFRKVTFTSAVGLQESFTLEMRPKAPFSAVAVLDAESTPFTESSGGVTITGQRMFFTEAATTEFRVEASGSGQLVAVPPPDLDPPLPIQDGAEPDAGGADESPDDIPVRIKAVVVHPTA
jgi:hypothetical protein